MNASLWKSPCVTTYSGASRIMLRARLKAPSPGASRGSMTTMIEFPLLITGEQVNGRHNEVSLWLLFSQEKGHARCFENEKRLFLVWVLMGDMTCKWGYYAVNLIHSLLEWHYWMELQWIETLLMHCICGDKACFVFFICILCIVFLTQRWKA